MAADTFALYKSSDNSKVTEGESPLTLTGLAPGTVVAQGDYKVSRIRDGRESAKVDVTGFTVLEEVPVPVLGSVTPTADGAEIELT
ncbi:hypothetical protein IGI96_000904 [Enterococcus sp. DIV0421]|uniref:hypothetical protein n=1 Tax=Enterococcus sp. DIV0421 TaxID=2774688 RepID=UPI003F2692DD